MKSLKKYLFTFCSFLLCFNVFSQQKSAEDLYFEAKVARDTSYFESDSLINLSIAQALKEQNDSILIKAFYLAAKIQNHEGLYEEAEDYFLKAIEKAESSQFYSLLPKYYSRLSGNYLDMGDMKSGVKTSLRAIEIAEENALEELLPECFSTLAEIYRHYDYYDLALEYHSKSLAIAKQLNNQYDLGRAYNNISAVLGEIDKNQEAIDSLKKGLSIIHDSDLVSRAYLNSNLGFCYRNMEAYQEAIHYTRISLNLKTRAKMARSIPYSLGAIGRAHLGLKNYDSALFYIQQRWELEKNYNNLYGLSDASVHMADVYVAIGDYKKAYLFNSISDSIGQLMFETETEHKVLTLQRKYDLSKKEQELEKEKNLRLLEKAKQKTYFILLLSALSIFILLAVLFRIRSIKRKKEKQLIELKLEAVENERARDQKALSEFTADLLQKNKSIRLLSEKLQNKENELRAIKESKSDELEKLSEFKILTEEDWTKFKLLFEKVYPSFFSKLNTSTLKYTKGEKRLMALIKLDMENNEIADVLGISSESVSKSRFRLKKKLDAIGISSIEELVFNT